MSMTHASVPAPELSFRHGDGDDELDCIFLCRFRPLLDGELDDELDKRQQTSVVFHKKGKNVMLKPSEEEGHPMKFDFDRVYPMSTSQNTFYRSLQGLVMEQLELGNDLVIVSCGAEGHGKTFTLWGNSFPMTEHDNMYQGIIPLLARDVLQFLCHSINVSVSRWSRETLTWTMMEEYTDVTNIETIIEEVDIQTRGTTTMISLQCSQSVVHFVDLALEDFNLMDSFVKNVPSSYIAQQVESMNEYIGISDPSSKFKSIVIAQCGPHMRDVLEVRQTLEKVNSYWQKRNVPVEHQQNSALPFAEFHKEPSVESDQTIDDTELKRIRKERDLALEQRQVLANGLKSLKRLLHEFKSPSKGLITSDDVRQLVKELEEQVTSDIISQVENLWNEWEVRVSTVEHQKQRQEHLLSQMMQMGEDIEKIRNQSGELDVMIGEKDEEMLRLREELDEHRYMVEQLNNELEVYANELEDRDETIFRLTEKLSQHDQIHSTQNSKIGVQEIEVLNVEGADEVETRNESQGISSKEEQDTLLLAHEETRPNREIEDTDKDQKPEIDGLREALAERDTQLDQLLKDLSQRDEMIAKIKTTQIELQSKEQQVSLEKSSKGVAESALIHELEERHEEDLTALREEVEREKNLLLERLKAEHDELMLKCLEQCEALEKEKQDLQDRLDANIQELQDAKEMKDCDQEAKDTIQKQSHEVIDEKDVLIEALEEQVEEYQSKLAIKEEEMERLLASLQEREQTVKNLNKANNELKIKVGNKQRDEEDMQRELVEQTTILAEREAENEELRAGVDKYQARVRDLVRMQEEFEELQDAMQNEIERLQHENVTLSRRLSQLSSPKDRQQSQAADSDSKNTKKFLTHIKKLIIIVEKSKAINAQLEYSLAMKSEECEKLREELYTAWSIDTARSSRRTTPRNSSRPKTPMKDLDQEILALKAAIQQVKSMTPRGHRSREKQ